MAGRSATAKENFATLRTIGEVAEHLDLPQHVLRFWETRFTEIDPVKRAGGRRFYRPRDIELVEAIRHLLYREGYTIKGVQRILKEQGVDAVIDDVRQRQTDQSPAAASPPGKKPDTPTSAEPPPLETPPRQAVLDFPDPEPRPARPAYERVLELELEACHEPEPEFALPVSAAPVFNAPVVVPRRPETEQTQLLRKALAEIEECKRLLRVIRR